MGGIRLIYARNIVRGFLERNVVLLGRMRSAFSFVYEYGNRKPSHKLRVQLVRSLVVSVIALVTDFSTLVALKEVVGLHYLAAATLSFILGVVVNYYLSIKWVFAKRKLDSRRREFIIFVIICAMGLVLNLAIIANLVQWLKFDYRIAKLVSTIVVFFWNFIARKKLLY